MIREIRNGLLDKLVLIFDDVKIDNQDVRVDLVVDENDVLIQFLPACLVQFRGYSIKQDIHSSPRFMTNLNLRFTVYVVAKDARLGGYNHLAVDHCMEMLDNLITISGHDVTDRGHTASLTDCNEGVQVGNGFYYMMADVLINASVKPKQLNKIIKKG